MNIKRNTSVCIDMCQNWHKLWDWFLLLLSRPWIRVTGDGISYHHCSCCGLGTFKPSCGKWKENKDMTRRTESGRRRRVADTKWGKESMNKTKRKNTEVMDREIREGRKSRMKRKQVIRQERNRFLDTMLFICLFILLYQQLVMILY